MRQAIKISIEGKIYNSCADAATILGLSVDCIRKRCDSNGIPFQNWFFVGDRNKLELRANRDSQDDGHRAVVTIKHKPTGCVYLLTTKTPEMVANNFFKLGYYSKLSPLLASLINHHPNLKEWEVTHRWFMSKDFAEIHKCEILRQTSPRCKLNVSKQHRYNTFVS